MNIATKNKIAVNSIITGIFMVFVMLSEGQLWGIIPLIIMVSLVFYNFYLCYNQKGKHENNV